MRLALAALAGALLLTSCSGGSSKPSTRPTSAGPTSAAPAPSASPADAYSSLAPPDSPGVGSYDPLLSNQAYAATQGFLATQLLEPATLLGTGDADVVTSLTSTSGDTAPARDLGGSTPKAVGLKYRPRFAKGVTLAPNPITVVSSTYTGDQVMGLGGESGLRVTWTGTIRYHVLVAKAPIDVTYALTFGYVFATDPQDAHNIQLQAVIPGTYTASPVRASCTAKGVLYPGTPAGSCPV